MPARPSPPAWRVPRRRLDALLDRTPRLAVVRGPAGSGKSTLVRDWVPASGERVVHVEVTRLAAPSALWRAVARGLGPAPACLDECSLACAVAAAQSLDHPVTVVLDDLDVLACTTTEDGVVRLLAAAPRLRVVVTGRTPTGLEGPPHDAVLDVQMVGPDELAPSPEEAASVLAAAGAPSSPAAVRAALAVAGSTVLGVRVLGLAAARHELELGPAAAAAMRATVAEASHRAVFGRAGARERARTAVPLAALDRIPAGVVADVLDPGDRHLAADLLPALAALGAGRWEAPGHDVFRLGPLVRDGLRPAFERLSLGRRTEIRSVAARHALAHDDPATALALALDAGDLALASRVAMLHWRVLSSAHRDSTIRGVEAVDPRAYPHHPFLEVLLALSLNGTADRQTQSLELFASSVAHLQERAKVAALDEAVIIDAYLSGVLRQSGRSEEAVEAALRADRGAHEIAVGSSPDVDALRSQMDEQNAMTLYAAGFARRALGVLRAGFARDGASGASWQSVTLLSGIGAAEGHQRAAAAHARTTRALPWAPIAAGPYVRAFGLLAEVYGTIERVDLAEAQERLDEIEGEAGANEHWVVFAQAQAYTDLLAGRALAGASRLARKTAEMAPRPLTPFRRSRLAALQAMLALGAGQGDRALASLRDADTADLPVRVVLARTRLALGEDQEAFTLLMDPTGIAESGPRLLAQRLLLLAATSARLGRPGPAVALAQDAVGALDAGGIRTPLLVLPTDERERLALLLDVPDAASAAVLRSAPLDRDVLPSVVRVSGLSDREIVVLEGIARGHDVPSLAAELYVSPNTVRTQVKSIYRKLGVTTRQDALAAAAQRGLLP